MQTSDMKVVRGIGIANVVISAIALGIELLAVACFALGFAGLLDPSIAAGLAREINASGAFYDYSGGVYLTADDIVGLTAGILGAFVVVLGIVAVLSLFCLIAGIKEMRGGKAVDRMGGAFGWSIAGAILAFCGGGFSMISMVLFIIGAIWANKARKIPTIPYGQPRAGYAPSYQQTGYQPAYGQPMPGQQGYAPQQPYQPQQPYAAQQGQPPYQTGCAPEHTGALYGAPQVRIPQGQAPNQGGYITNHTNVTDAASERYGEDGRVS